MSDNFSRLYAQLNDDQKRAVEAIYGPVLVIAGPGTGKTQLLSMRIANILTKTDTLAENILCLTFTESAVGAMRQRLVEIIGPSAFDVSISTYHGFGSELIRSYPEYFSQAYDLKPANDLVIDEIIREIQAKLDYSNPLKGEYFTSDLKRFITQAKQANLSPSTLRKILGANSEDTKRLEKTLDSFEADLSRLSKKSLPALAKLIAVIKPTPPKGTVLALDQVFRDELESAITKFSEDPKTKALSKWKNRWLVKNEEGRFRIGSLDQTAKLLAATDIYESYIVELAKRSLYDYDDMILRAIEALKTNLELRFTLQERYQFLLLDEFQDTNEAQLNLVYLLSDSEASEGQPNVLAVGDDDQAIYSFQGANYSHMLSFYNHYDNVKLVSLNKNYRSFGDILSTSDYVAGQLSERLIDSLESVTKDLQATKKPKPGHKAIKRLNFMTSIDEYGWLATDISRQVKAGIKASEIAVISPRHNYLTKLIPFLHSRGLTINYQRRQDILDQPIVRQLTFASRLVLALADNDLGEADYLWPIVLSLDFWELPTSLIWQLSWQASTSKKDLTSLILESKATSLIALFFINLSKSVEIESLEQVIDKLIGLTAVELNEPKTKTYRSPFYDFYFSSLSNSKSPKSVQNSWQILAELSALRASLKNYQVAKKGQLNLRDLVGFIEASKKAGVEILDNSKQIESEDSVNLLTAHSAKGQEFEVVYLIDLVDEVWGLKARSRSNLIKLPQNLEYIRYSSAGEDERLRLLYVSLTRAKDELYLTGFSQFENGRSVGQLKYLAVSQQAEADVGKDLTQSFLVDPKQKLETVKFREQVLNWQDRHASFSAESGLKELLGSRLADYKLSPTELNRFIDARNAGPRAFLIDSLLKFPGSQSSTLIYGSVIHQTLQRYQNYLSSNKKPLSIKETLSVFDSILKQQALSEAETKLLKTRGQTSLVNYLAQKGSEFKSGDLAEYNFGSEEIVIDEVRLNGNIDKLIVDEKAKEIVIVDYKTGASYSSWQSIPKLHLYASQLYFYKLLVSNSKRFNGYRVIGGYLEFVDSPTKINRLQVEYDEAVLNRQLKLMKAVWKHIQKLNFPAVDNYSLDLKGIQKFEEDLISGEI